MSASADGHLPPVEGARELRIEKVPIAPTRMRVRWLSQFDGIFVHFRRAQIPCLDDSCQRSLHELPQQWRGYAPVEIAGYTSRKWFPAVLELTERLYWCLEGLTLRGTVWDLLRRPGIRDRYECWGQQVDEVDPKTLRTDIDWLSCVRRRYFGYNLRWGKTPILGRPQVVTPSIMDPADVPEGVKPTDATDNSETPPSAAQLAEWKRLKASLGIDGSGKEGR